MRIGKKTAALLLILLLTVFAACGKTAEKPILRVGVMYSSDIIPLALMKDRRMDAAYGFTLDMQVFASAKDRDAALQAGELDGVFTDLVGMCIYHKAGMDMRITGVTDGDYLLLANPMAGIHNLDDAAGASVAISENTQIEYALDYILDKNGYGADYLKKEVVPRIPDRLELLRSGSVSICLLPEPFAALAQNEGAVLLGSANSAGLFPAVSAFSGQALSLKKGVLANFRAAYDQAVEVINHTPVLELEEVVIQGAGFPEELTGKIQLPKFRKTALPETAELQKAIDWAVAKGLCDSTLTPNDLLV